MKNKEFIKVVEDFVVELDKLYIKIENRLSIEERVDFHKNRNSLLHSVVLLRTKNKKANKLNILEVKLNIWKIIDWFLKIVGMGSELN